MKRRLPLLLSLALFLLQGCGLPHDTDSTLSRLRGGVLRAGVVEPEPEGRLILKRFAARYQATLEEVQAPPETLLQALKEGELQVIYGRVDEGGVLSGEVPTLSLIHILTLPTKA